MESTNRSNAEDLTLPTLQHATAIPPTGFSTSGMASMFKNSQNVRITGGSFNITTNFNTVNTINKPSLELLYKRVAPNAILNAGGRADEVRCHPGTRKEVISRIEAWAEAQNGLTAPMFWLSGPAGAGKSSVMQTVAECCNQHRVPHANFFFFREDSSRSRASPLIATLLYQVILLYPSLRDTVNSMLSADPLIFDSTLENQLTQLIVTPLRIIKQSSLSYRPLLLLIDGLDECDSKKRNQQQILHAFDKVLAQYPEDRLFRLLVASRDESQIRAAFNRTSSECVHLYLDNQYHPEIDIWTFVDAQFKQIKKTHPLAHTLDPSWPSMDEIKNIVKKSSGQFIYAATVMRFISDSSASPGLSLQRVQGATGPTTKMPFSHLDAIYTHILSQAEDQELLKDIFHFQLLTMKLTVSQAEVGLRDQILPPFMELTKLYKCTEEMVISCLANVTPIVSYDPLHHRLVFHHASFSDYLQDRSRSGDYFVDIIAFNYKVMPVVWKLIARQSRGITRWITFGIVGISQLQKLPPGLIGMMASSARVCSLLEPEHRYVFKSLQRLCSSGIDVIHFRQLFRQWNNNCSTEILFDHIKHIPFSRRYFQMSRCIHDWTVVPHIEVTTALLPETDFDRYELASWLNDLLHRLHEQVHSQNIDRYQHVLEAWISWAVENDVPCEGLDNLPEAQRYIQRSMTNK